MGMRDTSNKGEYCDYGVKLICKINPNKWCNLHQKLNKQFRNIMNILKLFVKLKKNNTKNLNLVIHRVRFLKNLQKNTIAFNGG